MPRENPALAVAPLPFSFPLVSACLAALLATPSCDAEDAEGSAGEEHVAGPLIHQASQMAHLGGTHWAGLRAGLRSVDILDFAGGRPRVVAAVERTDCDSFPVAIAALPETEGAPRGDILVSDPGCGAWLGTRVESSWVPVAIEVAEGPEPSPTLESYALCGGRGGCVVSASSAGFQVGVLDGPSSLRWSSRSVGTPSAGYMKAAPLADLLASGEDAVLYHQRGASLSRWWLCQDCESDLEELTPVDLGRGFVGLDHIYLVVLDAHAGRLHAAQLSADGRPVAAAETQFLWPFRPIPVSPHVLQPDVTGVRMHVRTVEGVREILAYDGYSLMVATLTVAPLAITARTVVLHEERHDQVW